MLDIVFVAVLIAFFALAAAFVRACERIIGAEPAAEPGPEASGSARERAA